MDSHLDRYAVRAVIPVIRAARQQAREKYTPWSREIWNPKGLSSETQCGSRCSAAEAAAIFRQRTLLLLKRARTQEQTAAEPSMKHAIYFVSLLTVEGIAIDDVAFDAPSGKPILVRY